MCYDASEANRWISATKIRQNVIGFSLWKLGNNSKHIWKASIETTPISKLNLKAQYI